MAALKFATVCMLLLFVGSDLARPAICLASSSPDDEEPAAVGALLQELLERELAQKLSLLAEQHGGVGDVCTPACESCLLMCLFTCAFTPNPVACFTNCTVTNGCLSKTLLPVA